MNIMTLTMITGAAVAAAVAAVIAVVGVWRNLEGRTVVVA